MCVTCFNSLLWRNIVCEVFAVHSCLGIITEISRFSQCRKSRWNPQIDRSEVWKLLKTPRRFNKISNTGNLCGILGLTISKCGNSWKSPLRFPQCFQCRKSRWNPQADCSHVWKIVETTSEVSPKFPKQESLWNPRADCSQVWKLVETTYEFSPKVSNAGNDVES